MGIRHASIKIMSVRCPVGSGPIFSMKEKLFPRSASDWVSPVPSNSSSCGRGDSIHFFWNDDVYSVASVPYLSSPDLFV